MIECPQVQKRSVRFHYDLSTPFYRLLWGEHIHHGLWSADESPRTAQLRLPSTSPSWLRWNLAVGSSTWAAAWAVHRSTSLAIGIAR